jgi:hypothetical protein
VLNACAGKTKLAHDLSLPLMPPVDLPPFEEGTHRGFITGDDPSQRAQQVLDETGVAP